MKVVKDDAVGIDLLNEAVRKISCGITAVGALDHVVLAGIHVLHRVLRAALGACVRDVLKSVCKLPALIDSRIFTDPVVLVVIDSIKDLLLKLFKGRLLYLIGIDLLNELGTDPALAHT